MITSLASKFVAYGWWWLQNTGSFDGLLRVNVDAVHLRTRPTDEAAQVRVWLGVAGISLRVQRLVGLLDVPAGPGWFVPAMAQEWVSGGGKQASTCMPLPQAAKRARRTGLRTGAHWKAL